MTLEAAAKKMLDMLGQLSQTVSLGEFENKIYAQYDALKKIAGIIPAPILSGEPRVDVTSNTAKVSWTTDRLSNSLVAFVPDSLYAASRGDKAYTQVVGNSEAKTSKHTVDIFDLKPDTVYHYQVRSKGEIGRAASSKDYTFKTRLAVLEIINYTYEVISPESATFRWLTSEEANTQITYTPFRNERLSIGEAVTIVDKNYSTSHLVNVENLETGVLYQVEIFGINRKGTMVNKIIPSFSTGKDNLPPEIIEIKTESALSQGKDARVQTVISWETNEPTIGQVVYAQGVITDEQGLTESTPVETSYTRNHMVVITSFKLGNVYTFRIKAVDSSNLNTITSAHTVLAPTQKKSVFDLIISTLETTFGWMSTVR